MISNFTLKGNKIVLNNTGEYFGALGDFEYNIGDKLYEFAIMSHQEFEKLKAIYTQLIELVCYAKEIITDFKKIYTSTTFDEANIRYPKSGLDQFQTGKLFSHS